MQRVSPPSRKRDWGAEQVRVHDLKRKWAVYLQESHPAWKTLDYWKDEEKKALALRNSHTISIFREGDRTRVYEPRVNPTTVRKRIRIPDNNWDYGIAGRYIREIALAHSIQSDVVLDVRTVTTAFPLTREWVQYEELVVEWRNETEWAKWQRTPPPPPPLPPIPPPHHNTSLTEFPPFVVGYDYESGNPRLSNAMNVVMDRAELRDLFALMFELPDSTGPEVQGWPALLGMATEAAHGLACLHEHGVVHRDLKLENLFVFKDQRIKLADFGFALYIPPDQMYARGTKRYLLRGTPEYMAPETMKGDRNGRFSFNGYADVWAFSTILLFFVAHDVPQYDWQEANTKQKTLGPAFRHELSYAQGDYFDAIDAERDQKESETTLDPDSQIDRIVWYMNALESASNAAFQTTLERATRVKTKYTAAQRAQVKTVLDYVNGSMRKMKRAILRDKDRAPPIHDTVLWSGTLDPAIPIHVRETYQNLYEQYIALVAQGLHPIPKRRPTMRVLATRLAILWKQAYGIWKSSEEAETVMDAWNARKSCSVVRTPDPVRPPVETWGSEPVPATDPAWTYIKDWIHVADTWIVPVMKRWYAMYTSVLAWYQMKWQPIVVLAADWMTRFYDPSARSARVAATLTYVAIKMLYELKNYTVKGTTMHLTLNDVATVANVKDPDDIRISELVFLSRTEMKLVMVPTLQHVDSDLWKHVNSMIAVLFPTS